MPAALYPERADGNKTLCCVPGCDNKRYTSGRWCLQCKYARSGNKPFGPPSIRSGDRDPDGNKYCFGCAEWKPLTDFHKGQARQMDGYKARCNRCASIAYRKNAYGLNAEDIQRLLDSQGNKCAVCDRELVTHWAVDHDHSCCPGTKTCGRCIRGVLCGGCNSSIGKLGDNLEGVMRAVRYLERGTLVL